jgi:hypothetical protein
MYKASLEESTLLQQRWEYTGNNLIYVGYANPGVSESDNAWLIIKYTYDSSNQATHKRFADSSRAFDKNWTDRAGYDYA